MLFIDLSKVYDSVPRCALLKILEQLCVFKVMINLLRSLHDGIEAEVTVNSCTSSAFNKGCTIAPTLFAL